MNAEIAENGKNSDLEGANKPENTATETTAKKAEPDSSKPKIDPSSANVVNNFIETLRSINFNYKTDRIFAYPELPGLLASSDALSLGDAHNQHSFSRKQFRELKSIETKICAFLKYENISEVDLSLRHI